MTETEKRYDTAPYDTAFDAAVLSAVPGQIPGTADVVLDATLFFPEEGGQTPDRGLLGGFPVIDVQISADNIITHTLKLSEESVSVPDAALPESLRPGSLLHGQIDWEHRYSNMQNHSGEHILSGILHSLYGYENVGFRLSDHTVTLDTSGLLSPEQILDLEQRANQVVWNNVPITCEYPSPEKLRTMEYRSKKELNGPVRIVTIEGVDVCACCAPHVRRTGEIGLIKILSAVREKKVTRLTILSGKRALLEMEHRQAELEKASRLMNEPQDTISAGVGRLLNEITALKESGKEKEMQYIRAELDQIRSRYIPGSDRQDLYLFERDLSTLSQRAFMNSLCEMGWRYAGVFVGNDADGWKYLIGSRGSDARVPNAKLREQLHAKGGGKPEMVQGTVPAGQEAILAALKSLS